MALAESITTRDLAHNLAHYLNEAQAGKTFVVWKHSEMLCALGPVGKEARRTRIVIETVPKRTRVVSRGTKKSTRKRR